MRCSQGAIALLATHDVLWFSLCIAVLSKRKGRALLMHRLGLLMHRPALLMHRPALLMHRPALLMHQPGLLRRKSMIALRDRDFSFHSEVLTSEPRLRKSWR